jgi:hypothetical protein
VVLSSPPPVVLSSPPPVVLASPTPEVVASGSSVVEVSGPTVGFTDVEELRRDWAGSVDLRRLPRARARPVRPAVPAGTYEDAWTRVQRVSYPADTTLCRGVGMVRSVSSDLSGSGRDTVLSAMQL